jgi:hypothetical protein
MPLFAFTTFKLIFSPKDFRKEEELQHRKMGTNERVERARLRTENVFKNRKNEVFNT